MAEGRLGWVHNDPSCYYEDSLLAQKLTFEILQEINNDDRVGDLGRSNIASSSRSASNVASNSSEIPDLEQLVIPRSISKLTVSPSS